MDHSNIAKKGQTKYPPALAIITVLSITTYILSSYYDVFETIAGFVRKYERWQLDECITVALVLVFALTVYSIKRWHELVVKNRTIARKNDELQKAFSEIRQLKGILPICVSCKKIRDDQGYWHQVELYIRDHTEAEFSHSICPECTKKLYPDIDKL